MSREWVWLWLLNWGLNSCRSPYYKHDILRRFLLWSKRAALDFGSSVFFLVYCFALKMNVPILQGIFSHPTLGQECNAYSSSFESIWVLTVFHYKEKKFISSWKRSLGREHLNLSRVWAKLHSKCWCEMHCGVWNCHAEVSLRGK